MVNVPVNDVLQFRVAAISRRHDGYLNNAPQADGDDENTRSGRLSVALEPTAHLRMLFTAQQTTLKGVGPVSLDIPYLYDANGNLSHDKPPFPADPRTFTYATPQSVSIDDTLARWSVAYDFPGVVAARAGQRDVELMAYVRNVTNARVFTAAEEYTFDNSYRYAFAAPRTSGVRATYFW